ncbi:5'-nucleotidase [Pseudomonas citronellolis]|uniref:5'-nucleotidase n=1 Tax=Pseudomonas citronellolis TaxID=53408 RepID=A0AAQ1HNC5_9PSED|nr:MULTISPECIES: 5'-nucleotidase [Pseudomonas]MCL6692679.1 5'-nucleotidase [Pseudomonas sp. R3.Fl]MCP1603033.1 5'-nucleotidase [Pseudomonas citronellolis]MCP1645614.1 5'-nucleotidase [Pseudomonas citronellolis]MCP1654091.1 5'-nucleotidase [Pseudomonas citronellolis]MCP1667514.1 5'-nucleotidase [Pseudomonas citronellolis]
MGKGLGDKLVVAISSRALFDLDESHRIYESEGVEAYRQYQIAHEDEVLPPGDAFALVQKLLGLNEMLGRQLVEVVLVSRNSADTGLRVFNSIQQHGLGISRAAFVGGRSPYPYLAAFGCHLFLSTHVEDVRSALENGFAAATILSAGARRETAGELRFAFDGDAVLFSDEAERVFQQGGLEAFQTREQESAREPLGGGPFKPFLAALNRVQQAFPQESCPIRTALVTARSAPAHERVIRTLREWDIRLDESLFLGGLDKSAFLEAFSADVFFDDQPGHCERAREVVATGHVPHGVSNEPQTAS